MYKDVQLKTQICSNKRSVQAAQQKRYTDGK